jgi:ribosomal protein S27AE
MSETDPMADLHVNDECPRCGDGVMVARDLIGDRNALVIECDRCHLRHAIPPPPPRVK